MEKIMDVMATLLTAIFFEVLPVSLQKEIEEKGYKAELIDNSICLRNSMTVATLYSYTQEDSKSNIVSDERDYLEINQDDEIVLTSDTPENRQAYEKMFDDAKLTVAESPVLKKLMVDYYHDENWYIPYTLDETYAVAHVEYRIPLDTVDITDTIRAAKKFAGLE